MTTTLVLNSDFLPLGQTSLARALRLVLDKRAEIIKPRGTVRSITMTFELPKIIRLLSFVRFRQQRVPFSKKNVIARDRATCQYCGVTGTALTVDHIIPQSRGGANSWTNLVAACYRCNNRKANRTPAEAGLPLRKQPREPHHTAFLRVTIRDPDFDEFLFGVDVEAELSA